MYNLYDIFRDKDSVIKSVGSEYTELDYSSLAIVLLSNVRLFNLLDDTSKRIVDDPQFYLILSNIKHKEEYEDMYLIDVILLELNNEDSKHLINNYGSSKAKDTLLSQSLVVLPMDIARTILFDQYDLNTIISMYNSGSYFRNLLDDPLFLYELIKSISNNPKLKPLPGYARRYHGLVYKGSNITFEQFVDWYKNEYYYVKDCIQHPLICYVGAKIAGDVKGTIKYLDMLLNMKGRPWFVSDSIGDIPPRYLLELVKIDDHTVYLVNNRYNVLVISLTDYPKYYELTDSDLDAYLLLFNLTMDYMRTSKMGDSTFKDIIISSLNNMKLFELIINLLPRRNDNESVVERALYTIKGVNVLSRIKYYNTIIQYVLDNNNTNVITEINNFFSNKDNLTTILKVDNLLLKSNNEYVENLHLFLKNVVSIDKRKFSDIMWTIINYLNAMNSESFSTIINIIKSYIYF